MLGDTDDTSDTGNWWDSLVPALRDIALTFDQRERTNKLFELNLERARKNLPPYEMPLDQLRPGVQIGMSADVKSMLTWLGIGGIAAAVFVASGRQR